MSKQGKSTECCPEFNPKSWDGKLFEWQGKRFIKDQVATLWYIPLNFGAVIKRMMGKVEKAGAKCQDWLCLARPYLEMEDGSLPGGG